MDNTMSATCSSDYIGSLIDTTACADNDNDTTTATSTHQKLDTLIDNEEWDKVYDYFVQYPNYAFTIDGDDDDDHIHQYSSLTKSSLLFGWTYLHRLCNIPSTSPKVLELLCTINPNAIILPDKRYNDTPLHLICRNSVISCNKVTILLNYCPMDLSSSSSSSMKAQTNNLHDEFLKTNFNQSHPNKQQSSKMTAKHNDDELKTNTYMQQQEQSQHKQQPQDLVPKQKQQQKYDDNNNDSDNNMNLKLILSRNIFGGTALHTACYFNSLLSVLQKLIQANPNIISIRTRENIHCISALFQSYTQTIHGVLSIARIIKHTTTTTNNTTTTPIDNSNKNYNDISLLQDDYLCNTLFIKFWNKVEFLSLHHFYYTQQQKQLQQQVQQQQYEEENYFDSKETEQNQQPLYTPVKTRYDWQTATTTSSTIGTTTTTKKNCYNTNFVVHGLLQCDVPINLYLISLKLNPYYSVVCDNDGNTPLHILMERRPYKLKEKDAIIATIDAYNTVIRHMEQSFKRQTTTTTTTTSFREQNENLHHYDCSDDQQQQQQHQTIYQPMYTNIQIIRNNNGEDPLIIGIRNKIPWKDGLEYIVSTLYNTPIVGQRSTCTGGLYPYQYAATTNYSLETIYQLLLLRPDIITTV